MGKRRTRSTGVALRICTDESRGARNSLAAFFVCAVHASRQLLQADPAGSFLITVNDFPDQEYVHLVSNCRETIARVQNAGTGGHRLAHSFSRFFAVIREVADPFEETGTLVATCLQHSAYFLCALMVD